MAAILVADDDSHIREVVRYTLERAGHAVAQADGGVEALRVWREHPPDLIILDITMPDLDGLEVCRQIRAKSAVPILFLSSRDEEIDRVLGLEIGGDDYVTKPFSPRELAARVKAMLRRSQGEQTPSLDEDAIARGPLRLVPSKHLCAWQGEEIALSATEFMILRCLIANEGRVFTRVEIVERAYGHGHRITERTVDSHVRRIRKKFAALGADPVETVYGVGYRLRVTGE